MSFNRSKAHDLPAVRRHQHVRIKSRNLLADPPPLPRNVGRCKFRNEGLEALHGYRRFILQCRQHPKCTASRTVGEQRSRHLGQYELVASLAVWARLGESVRSKSETPGAELKRELSRCRTSASGFKTIASCRRPSEKA